jgi:hypothetical protein
MICSLCSGLMYASPQMLVSSGLKKAHNLLLEIMVPSITRAFPRYFECIRCDVAIQVRSTDAKLEQDESVLLTDLDDHQKEQMGFLKVWCLQCLPKFSVARSMIFIALHAFHEFSLPVHQQYTPSSRSPEFVRCRKI